MPLKGSLHFEFHPIPQKHALVYQPGELSQSEAEPESSVFCEVNPVRCS